MPGSGEAAHVGADLGDDRVCGGRADAGDFIKARYRIHERGDVGLDRGFEVGDVGLVRPHSGDGTPAEAAQLADAGIPVVEILTSPPTSPSTRTWIKLSNRIAKPDLVQVVHALADRA